MVQQHNMLAESSDNKINEEMAARLSNVPKREDSEEALR